MARILAYGLILTFITLLYTRDITCNVKKNSEDDENEETEWRILKRGEPVPRQSHVSINLQTHELKVKVKKSDKKEEGQKTSVSITETNEDLQDKEKIIDDLQFRLHRISGDEPEKGNKESKKDHKKFKSYEELKKDFEELKMAVKTDIEIMNGIMETYKELVDDKVPLTEEVKEQQIGLLADLKYLVHQIDNANEFVKSGGLNDVVLPSLNSTSPEVRSGTARLLGSAVQNNIAVQIAALEAGAIGILLRILALDKTPTVRSSSLYALSCLVRRFPLAQKKLVDEGGLTVLNHLFSSDSSDKLKIQVKVVTLINDLLVEKQDSEKTLAVLTKEEENSNTSVTALEEAKERLKQYNLIGLETRLHEQKWCHQLANLLVEHVSQHLDVILNDIKSDTGGVEMELEHDLVERVTGAMFSSSGLCLSDFESNNKLVSILQVLHTWYKKLSLTEDETDNYYNDLLHLIQRLSWKLKISLGDSIKPKDEL